MLHRVGTLRTAIPPLRQRREDIPLLARDHLSRFNDGPRELTDEAMAVLLAYRWPGNVRELRNVLVQGWVNAAAADHEHILARDLPDLASERPRFASDGNAEIDLESDLAEYVFLATDFALRRHAGNKAAAARFLGLPAGQKIDRIRGRYAKHLRRPS
jgi:DNA-binding NtrC family response regulator